MTDFLLGFFLGGVIVFVYMKWSRTAEGPRTYNVQVSQTSTMRLHYLGSLDERKVKLLANWVLDNRLFQMPGIVRGKDKKNRWPGFLSENEFEGVREELLKRGLAEAVKKNRVALRPTGYAFFRMIAGRKNERTTNRRSEQKL